MIGGFHFCLAGITSLAVIFLRADVANAAWIAIKNDLQKAVVVQETAIVNGRVKRCRPVTLLPGETLRVFVVDPGDKEFDVLDALDPRRALWSGKLHCTDQSQTFSIASAGDRITVRSVAAPKPIPRSDRK